MSTLRQGDVIEFDGREQMVVMVNDCRARIVPTSRRRVEFTTTLENRLEFFAIENGTNIAPTAEVPVLARLGDDGLRNFLGLERAAPSGNQQHGQQKDETKMKVQDKTKRRGGLAAEGPILKGTPRVKPALNNVGDALKQAANDKLNQQAVNGTERPGTAEFVAVCHDQKNKVKDVLVLTTSYSQALRTVGTRHPGSVWMVTGTSADVARFDVNAIPHVEQKKERAPNGEHVPKWPKNPYDLGLWKLLEKGGKTLRQMADETKVYWTKQKDKTRMNADALRWLKASITDMEKQGLKPSWLGTVSGELEKVNKGPLTDKQEAELARVKEDHGLKSTEFKAVKKKLVKRKN